MSTYKIVSISKKIVRKALRIKNFNCAELLFYYAQYCLSTQIGAAFYFCLPKRENRSGLNRNQFRPGLSCECSGEEETWRIAEKLHKVIDTKYSEQFSFSNLGEQKIID